MVAPRWRAPNRRSRSTSRMAAVPISWARSNAPRMISAFTIEPPHQALELFQLLATQASAFRELRDEGRDLSTEQAIDEIATLLMHVVFATHQRPIQIATAIGCGGESLLLHQPREKSANRARGPVIVVIQRRHDIFRAQRTGCAPEHFQHLAFCFADFHCRIQMY